MGHELAARNVVSMLDEQGVPRERIAAIAAPAVCKAFGLVAANIDSHAARIEREILNAPQH